MSSKMFGPFKPLKDMEHLLQFHFRYAICNSRLCTKCEELLTMLNTKQKTDRSKHLLLLEEYFFMDGSVKL